MPLLPEILLRDLQLNRLRGVLKRRKKRGCGLANLEVDGAVLDLDDNVGFEFTVEGVEVVISGAGAVGFEIVVVKMVVVNEAAVEDDAAVGFEGASYGVGFGGCAVVLQGPAAFGDRP